MPNSAKRARNKWLKKGKNLPTSFRKPKPGGKSIKNLERIKKNS